MRIYKITTISALSCLSALGLSAQDLEDETIQQLDELEVSARLTPTPLATGFGNTRAVTGITRDALMSAPAGISGLKMLEGIPGVIVTNSDALGLYEFGNEVKVRAFSFNQLGFSLDGIPMGRVNAFGGSPIYRYVDNENLAGIEASTGTGDVTTPSYTALGGSFAYTTDDPKQEMGVFTSLSAGSNDFFRGFIRLDTGEMLDGLTAYVSGSQIKADLWRGAGDTDREHAEFKVRYQPSDTAVLNFKYVYNSFDDVDFDFLSLGEYETYGRYRGYTDSVPIPTSVTTATDTVGYDFDANTFVLGADGIPDYLQERTDDGSGNIVSTGTDAEGQIPRAEFRGHINARTDHLLGLNGTFELSENLTLTTVAYFEDKEGDGVSYDDYPENARRYSVQREYFDFLVEPTGPSWGLTSLDGYRYGFTTNLAWEIESESFDNLLEVGFWYESDEFERLQQRYNLLDGLLTPNPLFDEPVFTRRDFTLTSDYFSMWIKDTITLMEGDLDISLGVKANDFESNIDGFRNFNDFELWPSVYSDFVSSGGANLDAAWDDYFLPYVGVLYNLSPQVQIFASYAENMASPVGDTVDILQGGDPREFVVPEAPESKNYELGFRTDFGKFSSSITAYFVDFGNQIVNTRFVDSGGDIQDRFEAVGAIESYGIESQITYRPISSLALVGALTYNTSEFSDDYDRVTGVDANGQPIFSTVEVAGTELPEVPEWSGKFEAIYVPIGGLTIQSDIIYVGDRLYGAGADTAPSYTTVNAYIDWNLSTISERLSGVSIRANVTNITDEDALGNTFGGPGFAGGLPIQDRTYQFTVSIDL
ncbi:MAG: TonB-dependent receptor [Verrucomicrobiota bacterium]